MSGQHRCLFSNDSEAGLKYIEMYVLLIREIRDIIARNVLPELLCMFVLRTDAGQRDYMVIIRTTRRYFE